MLDILTIGDIKLDTFIDIPTASLLQTNENGGFKLCVNYGTKNQAADVDLQIAGSAPNVAIGLARMKKSAGVFSYMGNDFIHSAAITFLKKHHVDTSLVKTIKENDSSFSVVLNYKGESTQIVSHSPHEYVLPKKHTHPHWIHISELGKGYPKLYADLQSCCKTKKTRISLNPGAVQIQEHKKEFFNLLRVTSVLFVNKVEAEQILQLKEEESMHFMMAGLKKLGPEYIVITDGKNGAFAFDGKQLDYAPMFPGKRIEATGAGDAFASGFLGALMHGHRHNEALRWGSVNAASVVHEIGPTRGLLTHTEIKKRLKNRPSYKTSEL